MILRLCLLRGIFLIRLSALIPLRWSLERLCRSVFAGRLRCARLFLSAGMGGRARLIRVWLIARALVLLTLRLLCLFSLRLLLFGRRLWSVRCLRCFCCPRRRQ